jgi:hypothetical protein
MRGQTLATKVVLSGKNQVEIRFYKFEIPTKK